MEIKKISTKNGYNYAKEVYASIGVDVDKAIEAANKAPLSLHCWQGDDVGGFENTGESLSGGIAATGNYPGKARTPDELRADIEKAMSLIPGPKKVSLHANYLESDKKVDRNELEPINFESWIDWANTNKIGLDFNSTFFSHPKCNDGLTLSHPDASIRDFWIEHAKRSRIVAEHIGKKTGQCCINNLWIPDGFKDNPIDRMAPRVRLCEALDDIFSQKADKRYTKDAVESKLFGIGSESYVTGSHEFYMGYAMTRKNTMLTLDVGHFHPTESVASKISAILMFMDEVLIHTSRPVRWDSDHVVIYDDELVNIMNDIVRCGVADRVNLALDFFDASINRIAAWVIGARNTRKALLKAYLEPIEELKKTEYAFDFTKRLALTEEYKTYPFISVWDYYCDMNNIPVRESWLDTVRDYEKNVLSKR